MAPMLIRLEVHCAHLITKERHHDGKSFVFCFSITTFIGNHHLKDLLNSLICILRKNKKGLYQVFVGVFTSMLRKALLLYAEE